jgi:DNA polymerase III epsilon subunit-like protein
MVSNDGVTLFLVFLVLFAFCLFGFVGLSGSVKQPRVEEPASQPQHQPGSGSPPENPHPFWLPPRFVMVDLETTGLRAETHRITQVGAIKVHVKGFDGNRVDCDLDTFTSYVYPEKGARITAEITQLTGITRDILKKQGRPLADVLTDLHAFCEGLPMVAFNAEFDRAFLAYECARSGVPYRLAEFECALKVARSGLPRLSSYRLQYLCEVMKIANDKPHDALHDAKAALEVYLFAKTLQAAQVHGHAT